MTRSKNPPRITQERAASNIISVFRTCSFPAAPEAPGRFPEDRRKKNNLSLLFRYDIFSFDNALFPHSGSSRKLPGRFPEANVWNHEVETSKIQSAYHWHRRRSTMNYRTEVMLQNSPEASRKLSGRFPEVKPSRVAHGPKRRRGGRSSQLCGSLSEHYIIFGIIIVAF